MTCPMCGERTHVHGSARECDVIYRRRKCLKCNYAFYTEEIETDEAEEQLKASWAKENTKLYHKKTSDSEKIKVLIKRPDGRPRVEWVLNRLENLQKIVGGYIETVTFADDLVIICNEEGLLKDLPYNCNICGIDFVGTIIFIGAKDDKFTDCPVEYNTLKQIMPHLWPSTFEDLEKAGGKFE